jgi:branched-chain amino acid transport system substrate-binding protein
MKGGLKMGKLKKNNLVEKTITRREFIKSTVLATATAATIGTIGFPNVLRGAAPPEILIGHIHPLSGFLAFDGQEMRNAVLWGIQEVNDAGGIRALGGAKLKLIDADSEGKPEKSISEVERLEREGVVAITGCYQSAVTIVATQIAEKLKVPFVVGVASAEAITKRGFKYTFRIQPTSSIYVRHGLEYMRQLSEKTSTKLETIAYLHENTQYGQTLADFTQKLAGEYGFKVKKRVEYSIKAPDVSTEVGKIKAAKADLIFCTGYFGDSVRVMRALTNLRVKANALVGMASGGFSHPKFVKELGSEITEGLLDVNFQFNPKSPKTKKTRAGFKAKYGTEMSPSMVYAYSPVAVIADAIERAGTVDRVAIRAALAKTHLTDHILPQGPIEFNDEGQNIAANPLLMQVLNGNIEVVWPEKYATGDLIFPFKR